MVAYIQILPYKAYKTLSQADVTRQGSPVSAAHSAAERLEN